MNLSTADDNIKRRIMTINKRISGLQEDNLYFYNQPVSELRGGARVLINGREMGMYASYSYLGLVGHPRINAAAKEALDLYGTGTHGSRMLAGTLKLHNELEETIADFKGMEAAITYTSGYATNLTTVSTLVGRQDYVISDKFNHASIVDGCLMSGAKFLRFNHNDMEALENRLKQCPTGSTKLVIVDSVFSMDGDIINLPQTVALCRKYNAWLMVDEAHSLGMLGKTGRGIEEHFNMPGAIDIKMGTLSKTIPSIGGYIAGSKELICLLRHTSRAYVFSSALPPAQVAAAKAAFEVILQEPWRVEKLRANGGQFIRGLKDCGFNTLATETAIVPVVTGADEVAFAMTRYCQNHNHFVLPVVSPAVPVGQARLRATVTAAHEPDEINQAIETISAAGKEMGVI
ncbi:MAG: aminotransferase class I/II-fold pyridoxal phosphate-dependent enzyme [Deltaproteobacteria bacterium]|nr:aminotransferase class I/II-fold pyridoxal phosphate-dependent enzyme [Deltaproteobacteria bacterium]